MSEVGDLVPEAGRCQNMLGCLNSAKDGCRRPLSCDMLH